MDDVYVRIKARRREIGMTQKELARRCGYKDHTTINKMENGLVDMPLGRLRQIANALDMSFDELILGQQESKHDVRVHVRGMRRKGNQKILRGRLRG